MPNFDLSFHTVLGDSGNHAFVDALMFGEFCKAVAEQVQGQATQKGDWSVERPESHIVWLVLHRMMVQICPLPNPNYHQFQVITGPRSAPECEMWVLVESPQHDLEAAAPLPPSPIVTDLAPQLPESPTPSFGSRSKPHKPCHSRGTLRPTHSTHPTPIAASPKLPSTSHTEEQPSAPVSHSTSPKTSKQTKHPSKTNSLSTAKKSTCDNSSARVASCSNVPAQHSNPRRPHSSVPAQRQVSVRPGASAPSSRPVLNEKFKLKPITMAKEGSSLNVACVIVKVEKEGQRAKNNTLYDVLKVSAKEMMDPSSPRIYMKVKVFRNDGADYCDVSLRNGQVLLLKEMRVSTRVEVLNEMFSYI